MIDNWLWSDSERATIANRKSEIMDPQNIIEALLFWGEVPYQDLITWGFKKADMGKVEDEISPVHVSAMLIGRYVVMVRINKHPLKHRPYYCASFDPSTEGIVGQGPASLMEDCQRMCNSVARAIANNAAMASGPQVEIMRDRVDPSENIEGIWPWKIWRTRSDPAGSGKFATQFFQPNMNADPLLKIFNHFYSLAGETLGIPAYEHGIGNQAGGAGKTAHGLSMLMTAASKIMNDGIVNVDEKIIKPIVYNTWLDAILSGEVDYRGDLQIVARASDYLMVAEMLQARRQEFLAFTNNQVDMQIVGMEGRAKILREVSKGLKMRDEVVPPEWELEANLLAGNTGGGMPQGMVPQIQGPQPSGGGGGQVTMAKGDRGSNKLLPPIEKMAQM
jgi:hypothetical protein